MFKVFRFCIPFLTGNQVCTRGIMSLIKMFYLLALLQFFVWNWGYPICIIANHMDVETASDSCSWGLKANEHLEDSNNMGGYDKWRGQMVMNKVGHA